MTDVNGAAPDASLQRIIESAERLVGVHIDEAALKLTAMATQQQAPMWWWTPKSGASTVTA